MTKRLAVVSISLLLLGGSLAGAAAHFALNRTDVHYGTPYKCWKQGGGPFHEDFWGLLNVDVGRDDLIRGKTREEIGRKFGFIRERRDANRYQKYYSEGFHLGEDIIWLGDSAWLVIMEGGRGVTMRLMKG